MEKFRELRENILNGEEKFQKGKRAVFMYGNKDALTKNQRSAIMSYLQFYTELANHIPPKNFGAYEKLLLESFRNFFSEVFGPNWLNNNGEFVKTLTKLGINQ